jgi:hypothetical protein
MLGCNPGVGGEAGRRRGGKAIKAIKAITHHN